MKVIHRVLLGICSMLFPIVIAACYGMQGGDFNHDSHLPNDLQNDDVAFLSDLTKDAVDSQLQDATQDSTSKDALDQGPDEGGKGNHDLGHE